MNPKAMKLLLTAQQGIDEVVEELLELLSYHDLTRFSVDLQQYVQDLQRDRPPNDDMREKAVQILMALLASKILVDEMVNRSEVAPD